jgi:hypothetical protein
LAVEDGLNEHLDTLEGRVWIQLEWRALRGLGPVHNSMGGYGRSAASGHRDANIASPCRPPV